MKKKVFYSELAYLIGLAILAVGTAMMEKADFGMSMVVAPAYILHRKLSLIFPFFSFGMAEYTLQGVLLILLVVILRRFKISYLFSFVTAVLYGFMLDGAVLAVSWIPAGSFAVRTVLYVVGLVIDSFAISLLFHTYISPEVYELFVREGAGKYHVEIAKFKTGYDCISCAVAVILSFVFFGFGTFVGVKLGTVLCALVNGTLIGICSRVLERCFSFEDGLPWRKWFEK